MITKQQRETIGQLIEAKAIALAVLNQSDFASEFKARAAFDYVRASDELDAYLNSLVSEDDTAAAGSDGWIEWGGGECPVGDETPVDVRFRSGKVVRDCLAEAWDWSYDGCSADIIAYRIVGPRTNTN